MRVLEERELSLITGGSLWSEISKIFGREGKPFIGKDLIKVTVGVGATVAAASGPAGISAYSTAIGALASKLTDKIYEDRKNDK